MSDSKNRQFIPGSIAVLATPIGNMGDLSGRAKMVLEDADHIFCEDTRVAKRLLASAEIETKARLHRVDQHCSDGVIRELLAEMPNARVVVLSDAGTPGVNDPGAGVVRLGREIGFQITPIPGPSAFLTLFSAAGWDAGEIIFRGFLPRKSGEIRSEISSLNELPKGSAVFWFESPKRIAKSLDEIAKAGIEGRWILGKELTKKFEWIVEGDFEEIINRFKALEKKELGEWCLGYQNVATRPEFERQKDGDFLNQNYVKESQRNWDQALRCLIDSGISLSQASRIVSQYFGVGKNDAYEFGLKIKSEKK